MLSSTAIVGAAILESGSAELLTRIEAVKKRVENISTNQERVECNKEIQSLLKLTKEVQATSDKAAKENPNYLQDFNDKDFPNAKYVFANIDKLYNTCLNYQSLMKKLIYSTPHTPKVAHSSSVHTLHHEKKNPIARTHQQMSDDEAYGFIRYP